MKKVKKILFFTMTLTALMLCCLFSFTASAEAGNNFSSARSIKVNTKYTDNIADQYDIDYFKFTLPSAGSVYLNFTRENVFNPEECWYVVVYNSETGFITDYSFSGTDTNNNTHKVGLAAGTYFIRVIGGAWNDYRGYSDRYSNVNYSINVKYTKSAYWEKEYNHTYQLATKVSVNQKYYGTICERNNVDFYKFTISSPGYVYLNFTRENIYNADECWTAALFNAKTEFITDCSFSGSSTSNSIYKVGLSAGTYYVRIRGGAWNDYRGYSDRYSTVDYAINIKYTKSDCWETENNETYQSATKLLLNQKYSGTISERNDVDFYKFTLTKKTNLKLKFYENVTTDSNEYYGVHILNSNTNEIGYMSVPANVSTTTAELTLDPGTYYIRIRGGAWNDYRGYSDRYTNDVYSLSVSYTVLDKTTKITATKTASSVTLKWNKLSGISGYRVFQKANGKWKTLGDTSKTTYTIKNLKAGTKYTFAVRAYILNGKTKALAPKYKSISVTTSGTKALGVTSKITATQTTSSVTLKWNKVTGATGYRIYTMRKGEWKKLVDTTKLTYTEKKLGSGSMFKYRVKAYTTKNGKTVWATKYKEIETSTKPATTTLKVTSTAKGKAVLTWTNVSGESAFEIYYSTKKDSGFKKLITTKANATKATVSKLQSKKTYYFKVRSYKTTASGKAYSAYSAVKGVKVK